MAKCLLSFYSAFVAVLFGLVGYAVFADGDTYTCQDCYDRIMDCVTNGGSNCSSCTNCVQLSPQDCSNMVFNVRSSADAIEQEVYNLEDYSSRLIQFLDESEDTLNSLSSTLGEIINILDNFNPTNDVVGRLNTAIYQCNLISNFVSGVETGVPSSGNAMVYSNITTHAYIYVSANRLFSTRILHILNYLNSAVDAYGAVESSVIETHRLVRESVDNAYSLVSSLVSYLSSIRDASEQIRTSSTLIHTQVFNLQQEMDNVNCEQCSKGSGSGGGSSSGGGVDFTGAEAKLEEIRVLLRRMYDVVYNFYTDYNSARASVVSHVEPSYSGYSQIGNNWFQRVEYLLYSVSPLTPSNTLEGAENPSEIEGQTEFESNVDQVESTIAEHTSSLDTKVNQPLEKLKTSLNRFLEKMSVFKTSQSDDGGILWSHLTVLEYGDPGSNGFRLEAANESSGVNSTFQKLQTAFRVLWFLLTLALYLYLTIFVIKFNVRIAAFLLKLLNTSFGSN